MKRAYDNGSNGISRFGGFLKSINAITVYIVITKNETIRARVRFISFLKEVKQLELNKNEFFMLISDSGRVIEGGENLIGDNGLSAQQAVALWSCVYFIIVFSIGVLVAYLMRKRVLGGKMSFSRYHKRTKDFLKVAVVFAAWSVFFIYSLITDNPPLEIVGIPSTSPIQFLFSLFSLFFAWPMLALSVGTEIGSLIFPVKKPSDSPSSQ